MKKTLIKILSALKVPTLVIMWSYIAGFAFAQGVIGSGTIKSLFTGKAIVITSIDLTNDDSD